MGWSLTENKDGIQYYSTPSLEKVQNYLLELLIIADKVAKKNNIKFWIDGGTLIGAVRHGGFIPWDDDLDICLLKEDYDRFIPLLQSFIKDKNEYGLMYYKSGIPFWSEYLINRKVVTIHNGIKKNLRLDIVPIKLTENTEEAIKKDKLIVDIAGYYVYGKMKYYPGLKEKIEKKNLRQALRKKEKYFNYFINNFLNDHFDNEGLKGDLYNYAFNDLTVRKKREYYRYEDIFPLKDIEFEGIPFPAPADPDSYLKKLYSDYRVLPDLHSRKPVNEKVIFKNNIDLQINAKYIDYWNKYFFLSQKKYFKIYSFLKQIYYSGIPFTFRETILPFIKRGFRFNT